MKWSSKRCIHCISPAPTSMYLGLIVSPTFLPAPRLSLSPSLSFCNICKRCHNKLCLGLSGGLDEYDELSALLKDALGMSSASLTALRTWSPPWLSLSGLFRRIELLESSDYLTIGPNSVYILQIFVDVQPCDRGARRMDPFSNSSFCSSCPVFLFLRTSILFLELKLCD